MVRTPRFNAGIWLLAILVVAGLVLLALDWKRTLTIMALCLALALALTVILAIPTFLISLCLEHSLSKASKRTKIVAQSCFQFVGEIFSQIT